MKRLSCLLLLLALWLSACSGSSSPLEPPTDLSAFPGDQKLTLSWTESTSSNIIGYVISYQAEGKTAKTKAVGLSRSAILDGLENEVAYSLTIASQDKGGRTSPPSAAIAAVPIGPPAASAPATPTGLKAVAQDSQVSLTWTANLEPDLNHYTLYWGTSENVLDQFKVIVAPANSYILKSLLNGTTYYFALKAENALGLSSPRSSSISATPLAAPMAPEVSDLKVTVFVDGNPVDLGLGRQVRQGGGQLKLEITGSRLDTLLSARVGDIPFTITAKQADSATLEGTIGHGAFLGEQVLFLENDGGTSSLEGAVEVTRITSAENALFNPIDTCFDPSQLKFCGLGTPNRPFRTLSKALSVAGSGDTILLSAGTYSVGESWPLSSGIPAPNVPADVTIEGQSSDKNSVVLQGPGKATGYSGLSFAGNATVKNLSLRGFKYALILRQGSVPQPVGNLSLYNVDSSNNFDGVHVFNAESLTIQDSLFVGNGDDGVTGGGSGIYTAYTTFLDISGSTPKGTRVEGNVYGMFFDHNSFGNLSSLEVTQNIRDGMIVESSGINVYNSEFTKNGISGIYLHIPDFSRGMDISNTILSGNKSHGFHVAGNPLSIELDNCTLADNTNWQLFDQRDANNLLSLFSVNTRYQGTIPFAGAAIVVKSGSSGYEDNTGSKRLYRIDKVGNSINFSSL